MNEDSIYVCALVVCELINTLLNLGGVVVCDAWMRERARTPATV